MPLIVECTSITKIRISASAISPRYCRCRGCTYNNIPPFVVLRTEVSNLCELDFYEPLKTTLDYVLSHGVY
jgi:hypothetical protein